MKRKKLLLITIPLFALVACSEGTSNIVDNTYLTDKDSGTATINIFKDESATSKERYISPKNVEVSMTYNDLSGTLSNSENVCPSVGDVNLLVIPVHLPGSTFNTQEVKEDIEKTFFGKDDEDNAYMSLTEYYYESSFGKLNFQGIVTDWFDVAQYTNIKSLDDITMGTNGTIISEILRAATDWAFENYDIDRKDYDQNKDGSLDGIWLVYDHYNYFNQYLVDPDCSDADLNEAFWNYTSWDWYGEAPNLDNPTTSGFSWASFDQMYSGYTDYDENDIPDFSDLSSIPLDSHTFIHETGHLLGLDDLYTSDGRRPTGSSTMMDQNIGDLDPYSKLVLGWVTPYVVYGSSEILLTHNMYDDHSVIVIPSNYDEISATIEKLTDEEKENFTYEFNPFSEYLIIDLYSPLDLNYKDTYGVDGSYLYGREACVADTGVRIYHCDSRIFKCTVINYDGGQKIYWDENDLEWNGEKLTKDEAIMTCITNERSESASFGLPQSYDYFERLRLLEATGINSFDLASYGLTNGYASKETLWNVSNSEFDIFKFGYQFFNGKYTFNDGHDLPFKIKVNTLVGVKYDE